jgi:hypothetical protein
MSRVLDGKLQISNCIFWYEDRHGNILLYDLQKKKNYRLSNCVSKQIFERIYKGNSRSEIIAALRANYGETDLAAVQHETERFILDLELNNIVTRSRFE